MKYLNMMVWVVTLTLTVAGCTKKEESAQNSVDTTAFEQSFAEADSGDKQTVDELVGAIKGGDFPGALAGLQQMAGKANITPEQRASLDDLVVQLRAKMSELKQSGEKLVQDGKKTMEGIQDALPKK